MTVTAETVREVAEELRANDLPSLADSLDIFAKKLLWRDDPNVEAATAIRNAYYNDGVVRDLASSRDPHQWLRMAAAGREVLTPREPRRFKMGDPEPADVLYVRDEDGNLYKHINMDHWVAEGFFNSPSRGSHFTWHEMTLGDGAIEVFRND